MEKKIKDLICKGEKVNVEFKEAYNKLPKNLFESVCSFLNRDGGYIILGVDDNRKVIGVDNSRIESLKKDFSTLCNNPQKINPTTYLSLQELIINSKTILYVYIPESSNVHSSNGKIYDRNEDGDFDITGNSNLISNMYIRKKKTYFENNIYPFVSIRDLRKDLIERARIMACNKTPNHPWSKMSDLDLLKSASLYDVDYETGQKGLI